MPPMLCFPVPVPLPWTTCEIGGLLRARLRAWFHNPRPVAARAPEAAVDPLDAAPEAAAPEEDPYVSWFSLQHQGSKLRQVLGLRQVLQNQYSLRQVLQNK